MTIDPPEPIDFSELEKSCPTLSELTDTANSLPSIMDDAAWDELLNSSPSTTPAPAAFDSNASSDRVTIRLSIDVSRAYREAAARRGVRYQTLINDTLRWAIPSLGLERH
jgi:predicted DNA binding CopG/RHH family protein